MVPVLLDIFSNSLYSRCKLVLSSNYTLGVNMASNTMSPKGNSVALRTFDGWENSQMFGKKTETVEGKEMVTFMW